jgi:hypothetical protein
VHNVDNHFSDEEVEIPRDFSSTWTLKNREYATLGQAAGIKTTSLREAEIERETQKTRGYPSRIAYDKVVLGFLGYWKGI